VIFVNGEREAPHCCTFEQNHLIPNGLRVLLRALVWRKIIIKYNLEEYFGINVQMKVIDLEFLILSIQLDSPMLS
jgi:hypothetical protein